MLSTDFIPNQPTKPWFKRAWFISLVVLVFIWFGSPLLLKLLYPNGLPLKVETSTELDLPVAQIPLNRIQTPDDPWFGSPVAPVVIVEFGDFQCPFCRQAVPIIKEVLRKYPEAVKIIYRDFPVSSIHAEAITAAEAANCAFKQGGNEIFWPYHDGLFARQDNLGRELYLSLAQSLGLDMEVFTRCLNQHLTLAEIQDDVSDGLTAGVTGTPAWFINGRKIEGVIPIDIWQKIIDYIILNEFKSAVP